MRSFKKSSFLLFCSVAILLGLVTILCVRQYQLTRQYNTSISQSEEILFQFSSIREQMTGALIAQDWDKVVDVAQQLKSLNSTLARLQENDLIPGEFRLDTAKQVDLAGLAITSAAIKSAPDKIAHSLLLQDKFRILADYFTQFDRIIISRMRARVVAFQTAMIGALAAVICLLSFSLILLYKKTLLPLMRIVQQAEDPDIVQNGFEQDPASWVEISELIDGLNALLEKSRASNATGQQEHIHSQELAAILNESTNQANGIINYAQLLADSYREVEAGKEEMQILHSIIEAAERVAQLNRKI